MTGNTPRINYHYDLLPIERVSCGCVLSSAIKIVRTIRLRVSKGQMIQIPSIMKHAVVPCSSSLNAIKEKCVDGEHSTFVVGYINILSE